MNFWTREPVEREGGELSEGMNIRGHDSRDYNSRDF